MLIYYGRGRTNTYSLEKRLGGGGEGDVYEINGKHDLVAKIYKDSKFISTPGIPNPRKELKEKIETMLDQPVEPYINNVLSVAWPQDILLDSNGEFVGYVMPRVNSTHQIFAASRERERKQLFPSYTWKTAVLIARNLALTVKRIHAVNAIVGDMNPNNIMLDNKGHVTIIDTDSFNIKNQRTGKVYKCNVGVSEMLPPELQGKNLGDSGSMFTQESDNFALAIHIFKLLMNNCHPFGSIGMSKSQSAAAGNPIVHNIATGKCPYVTNGVGNVSPDAPDIMMLPTEIRQLIDRAFKYTVTSALDPQVIQNRPTAQEWQRALDHLYKSQLSVCLNDSSHVWPIGYPDCPWCKKAAKTVNYGNMGTVSSQNTISYSNYTYKSAHQSRQTTTSSNNSYNWQAYHSISPALMLVIYMLLGIAGGAFAGYIYVPLCSKLTGINVPYSISYAVLISVCCVVSALVAAFKNRNGTSSEILPFLGMAVLDELIILVSIFLIFIILLFLSRILGVAGKLVVGIGKVIGSVFVAIGNVFVAIGNGIVWIWNAIVKLFHLIISAIKIIAIAILALIIYAILSSIFG